MGTVLFIDEMQHLSREELSAICQACHETAQRVSPFFVVGAGLPSLPGILAEARSYSERLFDYSDVGRLEDDDARDALTHPADEEGVAWTSEAVEIVLEASGAYPYFIQQFGQTTWNAAAGSPISAADARDGIRAGRTRLDQGFSRARWERATRGERDDLAAMARDGDGPSSTGEVARRLDKRPTSMGPVRANLIAKGLVYAPEHGRIAFTVPGMGDFITREGRRS